MCGFYRSLFIPLMFFMIGVSSAGVMIGKMLSRGDWDVLAFITKNNSDYSDEIFILDWNARLPLKILEVPSGRFTQTLIRLQWSKDGRSLIMDTFDHDGVGVDILDVYTRRIQAVNDFPNIEGSTWLADNYHIAFVTPHYPPAAFIKDLNSQHVERYDNISAYLWFSAQNQVALQWYTESLPPRLYIAPDIVSAARNRQFISDEAYMPRWSNNGDALVFVKGQYTTRGNFDSAGIHLYEVNSQMLTQITTYGVLPVWSCDDARLLVFKRETDTLATVDLHSQAIILHSTLSDAKLITAFKEARIDWKPC